MNDIMLYEKHKNMLEKYQQLMMIAKATDNYQSCLDIMLNVYSFVKEISPFYYEKGQIKPIFKTITENICELENYLPKEYIVDIKPDFVYLDNRDKLLEDSNEQEILNYIVYQTRKYLNEEVSFMNVIYPLEKYDLENYCVKASSKVEKICNELNIKQQRIKLEVGFIKNSCLYNGYGIHYFNIVILGDKKYIVDCTYSQFFMLKRCLLNRIGIMNLGGCKPGIFMTLKESRKKLADTILKKGYIKIEDDTLKDYLDGFALSYRNGLYYEQSNDFTYETNYKDNDYYNFLNGLDNQLNHENKEVLGYQKKPLNNHLMEFKKGY